MERFKSIQKKYIKNFCRYKNRLYICSVKSMRRFPQNIKKQKEWKKNLSPANGLKKTASKTKGSTDGKNESTTCLLMFGFVRNWAFGRLRHIRPKNTINTASAITVVREFTTKAKS